MTQKEYEALSDSERIELNLERTVMGAVAHFGRERTLDVVREMVSVQNKPLELSNTLRFFKV